MRFLMIVVGVVMLTAGCASTGYYLVPLQGQSDAQRRQDGRECEALANQAEAANHEAGCRRGECSLRARRWCGADLRTGV